MRLNEPIKNTKVRHYAEDVTYQCQGSFTVKNDNTVPHGLTLALLSSTTSLIVDMTSQAEDRRSEASKTTTATSSGTAVGGQVR